MANEEPEVETDLVTTYDAAEETILVPAEELELQSEDEPELDFEPEPEAQAEAEPEAQAEPEPQADFDPEPISLKTFVPTVDVLEQDLPPVAAIPTLGFIDVETDHAPAHLSAAEEVLV